MEDFSPEREDRQGPAAPRSLSGLGRWRIVIVALGAVVLALGAVSGSAAVVAARPESCLTCHEMEPHFRQWQDSTHRGVSCIDCHTEPGLAGLVKIQVSMLKNTAGHVAGTYVLPIRADVRDDSCVRCHPKDSRPEVLPEASLRIAHAAHDELTCAECHGRLVHTLTEATSGQAVIHRGGEKACGVCHTLEACPHGSADVDCASCHSALIPRHSLSEIKGVLPRDKCIDCHTNERVSAEEACQTCHVSPHGVSGTCNQCHTSTETWHEKTLVHLFSLEGAHAGLACASCHTTATQGGLSANCASCHQAPHSPYGDGDCATCHTPTKWKQLSDGFDHRQVWDGYVGKHAAADCQSCHVGGAPAGTSTSCASCHKPPEPHFGSDCGLCHQPDRPFKRG